MLEYSDFYDIAKYGNENWKGSYTEKEVACNAYAYYSDFKMARDVGIITNLIRQLIILLAEDESEDAQFWYGCIIKEIRWCDYVRMFRL